jgi:hypothetical protein
MSNDPKKPFELDSLEVTELEDADLENVSGGANTGCPEGSGTNTGCPGGVGDNTGCPSGIGTIDQQVST